MPAAIPAPARPVRRLIPFILWLAAFYGAWVAVVLIDDHWRLALAHWPIAAVMALGSYVAGSTPMGGGTVAFPFLTLILHEPAANARDFSLAIQSVGMASAAIFILCRRIPLEWPLLRWTLLGSLIGTPLGAVLIAPHVSDLQVKLIFSVIWASFGIIHLLKFRQIVNVTGLAIPARNARFDAVAGLLVGLIGGSVLSAVTGVGIELLAYITLMLARRADLKLAIPTAVVLAAFTSIVGITSNLLLGAVQPGVFANWLAAAPVVVLGAPLGSYIVTIIPRAFTLVFVSLLCVAQFIWMCAVQQLAGPSLAAAVGAVLAITIAFHVLHRWGARRAIDPHECLRVERAVR